MDEDIGLRASEIRAIRKRLLDFYRERRRELPWRDRADPYGILVSEVMSQQTRVETVIPYYRAWMERFPTTTALAAADEDEVLSLWEGLGYYSRARRLQQAAREIEARYGGEVPAELDALRTLPGVGPYTAGAVASIAFGVPVPAVDGNVRRVLARLFDLPRPSPRRLETLAGALVDPAEPGRFNQALMELGSLVCTPRSPACARCPVADPCRARQQGTQESRPEPVRRGPIPHRHEGVAVVVAGEGRQVLLRRRPREGLLARMWEFPGAVVAEGETPGAAARRALAEACIAAGIGERVPELRALAVVDHAFSHLKVSYHPWAGEIAGLPEAGAAKGWRWAGEAELAELALPVAQRRILGHLAL